VCRIPRYCHPDNDDDDDDDDYDDDDDDDDDDVKHRTYLTCEITLHVSQVVDIEQLQHSLPKKHGLFQE
jgi:hypothetical protein